jgi:hypothetical protein
MNAALLLCLALDHFLMDRTAADKASPLEQTEIVAVLQLQLMCLYILYTITFFPLNHAILCKRGLMYLTDVKDPSRDSRLRNASQSRDDTGC